MMKPVDFEFIDQSGDSDEFHFGDFVNSSLVQGFVEKHVVVGFIFYFSLGPFFTASLVGRGRSFCDCFFCFLPSGDRLFSLILFSTLP